MINQTCSKTAPVIASNKKRIKWGWGWEVSSTQVDRKAVFVVAPAAATLISISNGQKKQEIRTVILSHFHLMAHIN